MATAAAEGLGELARSLGHRALVVTGSTPGRYDALLASLEKAGVESVRAEVSHEPTTDDAVEGARVGREAACDVVVAVGGGSAIDAGKAMAALLTNPGDITDYLEVVGQGRPLAEAPAPMIAVPTTAGTGAEVTRNAVLLAPEERVKVSMRSAAMIPNIALVDPRLTHPMPPSVTASTGLDALTQLIEAFLSNKANPLTDGICREGMRRAARSLRRAYEYGGDASAREDMAVASLFGGLALANAKLGAVHGFAGPVGGMFPAPHGAVCAALLPHVLEANAEALESRAPGSEALARMDELGPLLTGDADAGRDDALAWVRELCRALGVPGLGAYGLGESDVSAVVEKAARASSMKGNPIELTEDELTGILKQAI